MQKETALKLYADDTATITGGRNKELLNNHQLALKYTNDWIKENKLVLNAKKKNVLFCDRRNVQFEKEFNLVKETIEAVKPYKYLGVIIDCQLNFQHHMSYVEKRLIKFCGPFYRLRHQANIATWKLCGSTFKNVLKNLEILQNF